MSAWRFDCVHSSVELAVRHMLVSRVRGRFARWGGQLWFDPAEPEASRVEVSIEAASIDTGHAVRDDDLRGPRFLDVERFPTIGFRSLSIDRANVGRYRMSGEVTLRGVTRPMVLEVEHVGCMADPQGLERAGFQATGALDRREFGVAFNWILDGGGLAFGNHVELVIDVAAVREPARAAARTWAPGGYDG